MRTCPRGQAIAIAVLVALTACDRRAAPTAGPPAPSAAPRSASDPALDRGVDYLELATGGADLSERLPMIVALHGLGDRPDDFAGLLSSFDRKARLIVPRGLDAYHGGYAWFPMRGDMTSDAVGQGILRAADAIAEMVKRLSAARPTRGKAIVTGFSQGGALSFALAVHHADVVAAAFPIGGWMPRSLFPSAGGAAAPITALHGEADERVPIRATREAMTALEGLGLRAKLQSYPGVGHGISPDMRRDLEALLRRAVTDIEGG